MKINELTTEYATAWRNSFEYKGRCSRRGFWTFTLANVIVMGGIMLVTGMLTGNPNNAFYSLAALASFFPSTAIQIRRLHDTGRSGLCMLSALGLLVLSGAALAAAGALSSPFGLLVAFAGYLAVCVGYIRILVQKGTEGFNKYGENPLAAEVIA